MAKAILASQGHSASTTTWAQHAESACTRRARLDLLVAERLVVELKACPSLLPIYLAQVLSYLKASDRSLGLLIHFNVPLLRHGIRRVIRTR